MSALMAKLARSRCLWQTLTVVIVRSCGQADLQTAAGSLRFREGPQWDSILCLFSFFRLSSAEKGCS